MIIIHYGNLVQQSRHIKSAMRHFDPASILLFLNVSSTSAVWSTYSAYPLIDKIRYLKWRTIRNKILVKAYEKSGNIKTIYQTVL